ncbi:hypothetical protein IQ247_11930 [Plectonema cf. radiosum LEGE 06105]|uniref:Uncharacterized protein n=1 Tax=Plectonema cf. radiosum LEGE 06105 TaxID=945769 RepID=A0A8J7FBU0_9CYAN|nr:hypothetical protein [Plectonema radiosum]MBE9213368.1 hypothetical protein [Plectonema cf. radiosum LEGE 06105]
MKEVLELIEQKKQEFAKLPFFEYLGDESIDPRQRLVWVPYIAPFVMTFGELNQYFFRNEKFVYEKLEDKQLQELINQHTYEDQYHWIWFLEDLEKMGLNPLVNFTDVLKFIWSKETQTARTIAYELIISAFNEDPVLKAIVLESVEATGNVAFSVFGKLGKELEEITQKSYRYFSYSHLKVETGHLIAEVSNLDELLERIYLTPNQKKQAYKLVEKVFDGFTKFMNQMMFIASKEACDKPFIYAASTPRSLISV